MTKDIGDLSPYEKAVREEKEASARRLAALKADAAAEDQKVNDKVVAILRRQSEPEYQRLADQARKELASEKAARSSKARAAAAARQPSEHVVTATPQLPIGVNLEQSWSA